MRKAALKDNVLWKDSDSNETKSLSDSNNDEGNSVTEVESEWENVFWKKKKQ